MGALRSLGKLLTCDPACAHLKSKMVLISAATPAKLPNFHLQLGCETIASSPFHFKASLLRESFCFVIVITNKMLKWFVSLKFPSFTPSIFIIYPFSYFHLWLLNIIMLLLKFLRYEPYKNDKILWQIHQQKKKETFFIASSWWLLEVMDDSRLSLGK